MFDELGEEVENIYTDMIDYVYFMRGAISIDDAKNLTHLEKQIIKKYLNKRLENERTKPYSNQVY